MIEYLKGAGVGFLLGAIVFLIYSALAGELYGSVEMKRIMALLTFGGAAIGAIVALLMQRALERGYER